MVLFGRGLAVPASFEYDRLRFLQPEEWTGLGAPMPEARSAPVPTPAQATPTSLHMQIMPASCTPSGLMAFTALEEISNGLGVVDVSNQEVLTATQPPPAREHLMIPMISIYMIGHSLLVD